MTTPNGPRPPARRRASKFAKAGVAPTSVTAADTQAQQPPPATPQAPPDEEATQAPQIAAEASPEVAQGADPGESPTAPQDAPEGPETAAPAVDPKGDDKQASPAPADDGEATPAPAMRTVKLPDFGRLQARAHTTMSPAMVAMYNRSLTVQFMQVTASYKAMMKRQGELEEHVALARAAGFPESALEQLAMTHNWEVPEPPE